MALPGVSGAHFEFSEHAYQAHRKEPAMTTRIDGHTVILDVRTVFAALAVTGGLATGLTAFAESIQPPSTVVSADPGPAPSPSPNPGPSGAGGYQPATDLGDDYSWMGSGGGGGG
jgi:hypothetical protein